MRHSVRLALCALLLSLGACAIGNQHQYAMQDMTLPVQAAAVSPVAVAVHDQRPYVISGNKSPNFVGLQRGGFGNPFDVTTTSDKPLADDIAASITAALERGGARATAVALAPSTAETAARQQLVATGANRGLLLTMREWKADTYARTALLYDLRLEVLNREGQAIATSTANGRDNLGAAGMVPAETRENVAGAYRRMLQRIFSDPSVQAALR